MPNSGGPMNSHACSARRRPAAPAERKGEKAISFAGYLNCRGLRMEAGICACFRQRLFLKEKFAFPSGSCCFPQRKPCRFRTASRTNNRIPDKASIPAAGKTACLTVPLLHFQEKPQSMARRQRIKLAAFLPEMLFWSLLFQRLTQVHPGNRSSNTF